MLMRMRNGKAAAFQPNRNGKKLREELVDSAIRGAQKTVPALQMSIEATQNKSGLRQAAARKIEVLTASWTWLEMSRNGRAGWTRTEIRSFVEEILAISAQTLPVV